MGKIVRLEVDEDQHRALRMLAAHRGVSMQALLTAAVRDSKVTSVAMHAPATFIVRGGREKGAA